MQHLQFGVMTLSGFCIEFHRLGLRISGLGLRYTRIPSIRSSGISLVCKVLGLSPLGIHPSLPPEGTIERGWVYYFLRPLNYPFVIHLPLTSSFALCPSSSGIHLPLTSSFTLCPFVFCCSGSLNVHLHVSLPMGIGDPLPFLKYYI